MPNADVYPQLSIEAVIVLAAALFVGILLYPTPLHYPFRLLFTTIHELGHVLARILTGGKVEGFWVYFDSDEEGNLGKARGDGGDARYIIPAGYLGTAIFGGVLILLSGWPYAARYTVAIIGGFLILLIFTYGRSCSTLFIGLVWGAGFIWVAWNAELVWSVFLLYLLIVLGVLRSLRDWRVSTALARQDPLGGHDAAQMAKVAGRSARFWAFVWSVTSFLILAVAFWFVWLRNLAG